VPVPSRGDVFFAVLDPTRGSEQAGTRPVAIVSRDSINHNSPVVICIPFTDLTNCSRIYPSQILVKKGVGGLAKDSVALCEQVRAITVARLKTLIGRLDRQAMAAIDERLKIALDLD
jgi:mRNA interferase MazF